MLQHMVCVAWHGMAWHSNSMVHGHGMAWHGAAAACTARLMWHGMAWHSNGMHSTAHANWHGMAWPGLAGYGMATKACTARLMRMAWHGCHDMPDTCAVHGNTCVARAWQGTISNLLQRLSSALQHLLLPAHCITVGSQLRRGSSMLALSPAAKSGEHCK